MAAPIAVRGSSMRTFAFTDAGLRKLPVPPKPEQADHFDTVVRGLGLRVSYGGKRSFFLMFSVGGRRCRLSLGEFGNLEDGRLSLSAARKRARVKLGEIAADKNPAAEAREARLAPTVEALVADFIEAQRRRGIRSADKQRRMLARHVLPAIGQLKARDVTRADIRRILQAVADRGAPIESNRLHEVVRRLFHFAMDESCVEANPALRLSRYRERPRERWLSLKELGSYWNALPDGAAGDALRLCLLTAQRQGNVLAMRSDQVSDRLWIIPASTTKTGRTYKVPLSDAAMAIVERRLQAGGEWLFPKRGGDGPACSTIVAKAHRAACKRAGIVGYRPHDHRHTFATHAEQMGIPRIVWDGLLGHAGGSMADVYSSHDFADQRRECMEAWGRRVTSGIT